MSLSSWGNFPQNFARVVRMRSLSDAMDAMQDEAPFICYGNGRSYGDSAIGNTQLDTRTQNKLISFDNSSGILETQAGVLLADILKIFIPRLWNLPVVPGTKLITVGGAIASDIHGKNHHLQGCFSETVVSLKLLLPSQQVVRCSAVENAKLFHATCGGQGLTGVIVSAELRLTKVSSNTLDVITLKAANLKEAFSVFEKNSSSPYSVAWIDCLAQGEKLGRSLVSLAKFSETSTPHHATPSRFNIPFYFPDFVLNKWLVRAFNSLYYNRIRKQRIETQTDLDSFFFPLDRLSNWNRVYGRKGFIQYQFILPLVSSFDGMSEILGHIADSKKASFLAVLKLHGAENKNLLSFPIEGYSLALDFKITPGLFDFLDELDQLVLKHQGRIYLAKDARMSKEVFEAGYPKANDFRNLREQLGAKILFQSRQSERLKL